MSNTLKTILGKIKVINQGPTNLASQRVELGKGKSMLDEAQGYQGDLEFFYNRFETTETVVRKALQTLGDSIGTLEKIKEEVDAQGEDANSVAKEAAKLSTKMDRIAQEMFENDLDGKPVMNEVELLDKAVAIGEQTKKEADLVIAAINNLLAKI